jgi:hypothetical protein
MFKVFLGNKSASKASATKSVSASHAFKCNNQLAAAVTRANESPQLPNILSLSYHDKISVSISSFYLNGFHSDLTAS